MEKETLKCEIGNHLFEREITRGRKPRFCPEHKPEAPPVNRLPQVNGKVILHCEVGNHDWDRAPQRGRPPINCPEHSEKKALGLGSNEIELKEYEDGSAMFLVLDEEFLSSLPKTEPQPKRGRGRPRIYETDEEREAAAIQRSHDRVDELETSLKARGTHLSQQTPYILFKVNPDGTSEKAGEYSPLAHEQFLNKHEKDFLDGKYRFVRSDVKELVDA